MVFYETMQERVARILAELYIRAEPRLRYVAACTRQIRFGLTAFANAVYATNLTLVGDLFLNLNFILVDLLLNFIIAGAAD